jgi:hypothetical protein
MCHERLFRRQERAEEARGERLWDLFYRETKHPAPAVPIAEREEEREAEREDALSGTGRRTND